MTEVIVLDGSEPASQSDIILLATPPSEAAPPTRAGPHVEVIASIDPSPPPPSHQWYQQVAPSPPHPPLAQLNDSPPQQLALAQETAPIVAIASSISPPVAAVTSADMMVIAPEPLPSDFIDGEPAFIVEKIVGQKTVNGRKQYKVQWKDFAGQDTWEPEDNVAHCVDLLEDFRRERAATRKQRAANTDASNSPSSQGSQQERKEDRMEIDENGNGNAEDEEYKEEPPDAEMQPDISAAATAVLPIPDAAASSLTAFLEYIHHTFTSENWFLLPLQANPSITDAAGIAGSNVDLKSMSTALHVCLSGHIDVSRLASVESYQHFLTDVLMRCLEAASRVRLFDKTTVTVSKSDGVLLQKSVLACTIAFQILSMPNVPRPLIREEYLSGIINYLIAIIRHILLPLYDSTARDKLLAQTGHAQNTTVKAEGEEEKQVNWKQLESRLQHLVHTTSGQIGRLTQLLSIEKVPDLLTTQLLDVAYTLFGITPVSISLADSAFIHSLQSSASQLVQKIFLLGDSSTRNNVLDAIVSTYREMNPARRNPRTYIVHQGTATTKKEVKKETAATTVGATFSSNTNAAGEDLSSAIGSSIPLPSPALVASESSTVSIQLLTALACQLLQSISTEPLRMERQRDATSLLDRIKAEVTQKELARAAESEAATAVAASSGKKKRKGSIESSSEEKKTAGSSKKKKGGKKSDQIVIDEEMTDVSVPASAVAAAPSLSESHLSLTSMSAFNSALDTPLVRNEFIDIVTAPVQRMSDSIRYFLRLLMERIQPPVNATSSSTMTSKNSRLLLKNFVEDLLQILFTPEFPIAEQMITSLTILMINIVDAKEKSNAISDRFKMSCMSTLSLIAIHLKRHDTLASDKPLVIRPKKELVPDEANTFGIDLENGAIASKVEEVDCVCGYRRMHQSVDDIQMNDGFMVDCDECHTWYHGPCVGILHEDMVPSGWHCESCVIRLECARQTAELSRKRQKINELAASALAAPSSGGKHKKKKNASISEVPMEQLSVSNALTELESSLPPLNANESAKVGSSVIRQLLINYLDHKVAKKEDDIMLFARQYDLCTWLHHAKQADAEAQKAAIEKGAAAASSSALISASFERDLELVQINFEPPSSSSTSTNTAASSHWVTREMGLRVSRQLCAERPSGLIHLHRHILVSLCVQCNHSSPKFRSTAVSALADLVRVEPQILKENRVKDALFKRLTDSSISTREAVVDLLGTHMLQAQAELNVAATVKPEPQVKLEADSSSAASSSASAAVAVQSKYSLDTDYFRFVLNSLNDSGISVRKRVVRILRDLCLQTRPHPHIINMCAHLIGCVRDTEESMQSLSVTIIYEMWFDRTNAKIRERQMSKKMKDEPMVYESDQQQGISLTSPFTPQFQQLVQTIVGVVNRLSMVTSAASNAFDGVEALTDILLLLLEQESSLTKAASSSASGEMTSLTGLKMNLLKLSREQRKRQQSRVTSGSKLAQKFDNADKPTKRRQSSMAEDPCSIRCVCEDMVRVIVDLLVHSASTNVVESQQAAQSSQQNSNTPIPPPTRLSCIQALHVFSQVDPSLLMPHVVTLRPYLSISSKQTGSATPSATPPRSQEELQAQKRATANDTTSVNLLLEIFREVLYFIDSPASLTISPRLQESMIKLKDDPFFGPNLLNDLSEILTHSNQPALIKASVPTLAVLGEKLLHSDVPIRTTKLFVAYLWFHQGTARNLTANHLRALIGAAQLVKHIDIEAHYTSLNAHLGASDHALRESFWADVHRQCCETNSTFKTNVEFYRKSAWMLEKDPKRMSSVVDPIFALYRLYLRAVSMPAGAANAGGVMQQQPKPDGNKQAYILQGIIAMFSRKPTLIPTAKEVIDICLSSTASPDLQRQALRSLREFLQNEDRRVQRTQREDRVVEKIQKKSKKKKNTPTKRKKGAKAEEEEEEEDDDSTMEDVASASSSVDGSASKKSWLDSTIDASDFLPPMVSMCEKYVYQLALSHHSIIRSEALQFMSVFLNQAVTNPVDAMPSLIAALTDRQAGPQKHAISIVNGLVANKKEFLRFMEQRFADGIRLSFELQSKLLEANFDPLHRRNLNQKNATSSTEEAIFDRPPLDGFSAAYSLLKKTVSSRRAFCRMLGVDLLSVNHIGVFARQSVAANTNDDVSSHANTTPDASPVKGSSLHPPNSLNSRALSGSSLPPASPIEPHTPTGGSQSDEFPAFVPPAIISSKPPSLSIQSIASPASSLNSLHDAPTSSVPRPHNALEFLAYVSTICTALPFEDDEPLQLCAYLSKVINTHGASLQSQMQSTIVALKKLNGETVDEADEEEASIPLAQPIETGTSQFSAAGPVADKQSLLASLTLQCQSAMAITILIQLRQWLQKSYELTGLFEQWSTNSIASVGVAADADASSCSSSTPSSRAGPMKLSKKQDLPLHFNTLPLDPDLAARDQLSATKPLPNASQRKVAGRASKSNPSHARHSSAPPLTPASSIIPPLANAQYTYFNSCMERETLFLAMKATKKRGGATAGHKRSATTTAIPDEEGQTKKKSRKSGGGGGGSAAAPKKKSQKKKKRKFTSDDDDEEEEDESADDDNYSVGSDDEEFGSGRKKRGRAASGSRKKQRLSASAATSAAPPAVDEDDDDVEEERELVVIDEEDEDEDAD